MMSKDTWLAGAAAIAILASTGAAQAGGFALREQSAVGLGNSFAGAAAGGSGLASMFWNPATMTDFSGIQSSSSLSVILPYANITPNAAASSPILIGAGGTASSGDLAHDAVLPASYASWQVSDRVWIGLSMNTPYGLSTETPFNWSGQIYGRSSKVMSFAATPTVAVQVTDWLSLGAGLQVEHFKVRLTSAQSPLPNAGTAELVGKDTTIGYTLGATIKPWAGTEIGVGYRSQVDPHLKGTLSFAQNQPLMVGSTLVGTVPAGSYAIQSNIKLPDQVTVGVRQKVTNELTLLAGYEWTHWSIFNRFAVQNSPIPGQALDFEYSNGSFYSIGAEYAWSPTLLLRAGLGFEKSPVTDRVRSVRLPDSNRIWTTVGASYKVSDKLDLDFSYAHVFPKSAPVNIVSGNPAYTTPNSLLPNTDFVGSAKARLDLISVGLTYRWDEPKKAIPAKLPLVTKG